MKLNCRVALGRAYVLGLLLVGASWAADLPLFQFSDEAAARAAWQPGTNAPPVRTIILPQPGLEFPVPFEQELARVFWDRTVSYDLSAADTFELDLVCDPPGVARAFSLYFRSGAGWYGAEAPLTGAGRQLLVFPKAQFTTEGRPGGWQAIDRVRISPWRGAAGSGHLRLFGLNTTRTAITVVEGTQGLGNANERAVARRLAQRVSQWLQAMSIPHQALTDDALDRRALAGQRLVILAYNPTLPRAALSALRRFVQDGGQLMVFYSGDAGLAQLMGVRLGPHQSRQRAGQWSAIAFREPARYHVAPRILQASHNIRVITPARADAQVIADWLDGDGRRTGQAAWVASPQGFWMSHVLLPDDGGRKRDMLLGLMATAVPELWGRAAWRRIQETGSLGGAAQPAELAARLRAQAQATPGRAAVEQQVAAALAAHAEAVRAYQAGDYRAADLAARAAGEHFTHALARSLQPVAGEFRGVWDHDGLGWHNGDWQRTSRELKGFGINAVLPNVAWPGKIHYAGAAWPRSARFAQYGDLLAAAIKAAQREKIAVHAWKICWNLTAAEPDLIRQLRREGRLMGDDDPAASPWLNPADPRNRAAELAAVLELATQYDVAGVHLDYIRYPTGAAGYDAATRRSFEAGRGGVVDNWPAAILPGGARHTEFTAWRCAQITSFLAEVRAALRAAAPNVKLSVAVFGNYPETRVSIGQDWGAWLAQDLVDFICPMNYTTDAREFRQLVARQVALPGAADRIYPGLGITASATQVDGLGALTQVQIARELGTRGFVLFQLDAMLREHILPLFAEGLTRE